MIDFNRLNLLTGAYIAGELQRQGLSPEEAAKFYIQQSRSPEAATSFDMSVLDQDDATRTPADLAELEDLTQDQIQKRRGAEVVALAIKTNHMTQDVMLSKDQPSDYLRIVQRTSLNSYKSKLIEEISLQEKKIVKLASMTSLLNKES